MGKHQLGKVVLVVVAGVLSLCMLSLSFVEQRALAVENPQETSDKPDLIRILTEASEAEARAAAEAQRAASEAATDPSAQGAPQATGAPQTTTGTVSDEILVFYPNPTTRGFIKQIGETARVLAGNNDLYASIMIAQAILESGSGSSGLSKPPNNNLFGIKGSYKGQSVSLHTQEDDGAGNLYTITAGFRKYPSTAESLQDYVDLLTVTNAAYYAPARKSNTRNYIEACDYLQGHYATGTSYSRSLQGIIKAYDLTQYDHPASIIVKEKVEGEQVLYASPVTNGGGRTLATATGPSSAEKDDDLQNAVVIALAAATPFFILALVLIIRHRLKSQ